jgi:hypothetical protein
MAGASQHTDPCEIVSCRWEHLDRQLECFAITRQARRRCVTRITQALHIATWATPRAFEGRRGRIHDLSQALWPSYSGGV